MPKKMTTTDGDDPFCEDPRVKMARLMYEGFGFREDTADEQGLPGAALEVGRTKLLILLDEGDTPPTNPDLPVSLLFYEWDSEVESWGDQPAEELEFETLADALEYSLELP